MAPKNAKLAKHSSKEFSFPRGGGAEVSQSFMEIDNGLDADDKGRKRKKDSKRKSQKLPRIQNGMQEVNVVEMLAKRASKKVVSRGVKLWGMVVDIGKFHLKISLPNGLEGQVHASEASDYLADAFELMDNRMNTSKGMKYPQSVPKLANIFFVGQLVSCVVIDDWEPRKPVINPAPQAPVSLSLVLRKVHSDLISSSLRDGMMISGCVTGIEDHGYKISLGLNEDGDQTVWGFLPQRQSSSGFEISMLCGMIVDFSIEKMVAHKPIILSCVPEEIVRICRKPGPVCEFGEVLPGMLVNATIQDISSDGLSVSFLDHVGHVGLLHLQEDIVQDDWQQGYSLQQTLSARVIQVNPETHYVGLSFKAHLIEFTMPAIPPIVGQVVEKARILQVDSDTGFLIDIPYDMMRLPGYVDKSMVDDALVKQMDLDSSSLKGSNLKIRVTGFRPIDGLLVACSKKGILSSCFTYEDLMVGALVEGTVAEVEDGKASLVKLAEGVRGFVPLRLRGKPDLKGALKIGSKVQCRVVSLKPIERKVQLTTNERLVNAKHPTVSDWGDLSIGMRTTGWISGSGLGVRFYGGLIGCLPYELLGVASCKQALQKYTSGDVLTVYIAGLTDRKKQISLSLRKIAAGGANDQPSQSYKKPSVELAPCSGGGLWPGDLVQARFIKILTEGAKQFSVVVSISSKVRNVEGEAILPKSHLSDTRTGADVIYNSLHDEATLGTLMVLQVEPFLLVTRKPSLLRKAESLPTKLEDIKESMMLNGYVSHVAASQVSVKFLGSLEGSVKKFQLPLPDVPASSQCYIGQSVLTQVIRVYQSSFALTMNRSRTGSTDAVYLHDLFRDIALAQRTASNQKSDRNNNINWRKDLCIGRIIRVVIVTKNADGWFCYSKKHPEIQGFIDKRHHGNSKSANGDDMDALVLDIDPENVLRLSLRPELLVKHIQLIRKPLAVGLKLQGIVEMLTNEYAVVSIPARNHEIVFAASSDYNIQGMRGFDIGQKIQGVVSVLPCKSTGLRTLMYVPLVFRSFNTESNMMQVNATLGMSKKLDSVQFNDEINRCKKSETSCKKPVKVVQESPSGTTNKSKEKSGKNEGSKGIPYAIVDGSSESIELFEVSEDEGVVDGDKVAVEDSEEVSDDDHTIAHQDDGWGELVLKDADENIAPEKKKRKPNNCMNSVSNKRMKTWEEKEDLVREEEKRQSMNNKDLETDTDFEKLVMEEPNSSYAWIQYMSFLLSLGEVKKARSVAERALETINFREEQEKLNVWVAYLNLENQFGNPPEEAVGKLFLRAIAYNNPKKLHLALLGILEGSKRTEMIHEVVKTMCRKFSGSAKVWLRAIEIEVNSGEHGRSKNTLARGLASLPAKKHIKLILKVALMHFRMGNLERGREMFEGLITNYPKRLDLWRLYIDQEIRVNDEDRTRSLFERATHLQLPPKKVKHLFKTYLKYMKDRGDAAGVIHVKRSAMEYVERLVAL